MNELTKRYVRKLSFLTLILGAVGSLFSQFSHEFILEARNTHYGSAENTAVGHDGTLFLANGAGGLHAYQYADSIFSMIARIEDGGTALGVTIDSDGTIFAASGEAGLRAYLFDGESFTMISRFSWT